MAQSGQIMIDLIICINLNFITLTQIRQLLINDLCVALVPHVIVKNFKSPLDFIKEQIIQIFLKLTIRYSIINATNKPNH